MDIACLPVGARVRTRDGAFSAYVAAQDHPGYGGTTLLLENIAEILPFDGAEPENPRRRNPKAAGLYGDNRFSRSNLRAWLNGQGPDWYVPGHPHDAPPTAELAAAQGLNPREFDPAIGYPYWLRSIDLQSFSTAYVFGGFGPPNPQVVCRSACGIRPLAVLAPDTLLTEPDRFGVYHLRKEQPHE